METEEHAFWKLAVLLKNVLVNEFYADNFIGCHVEQRVFNDLLTQKCPRLVFSTFISKIPSDGTDVWEIDVRLLKFDRSIWANVLYFL